MMLRCVVCALVCGWLLYGETAYGQNKLIEAPCLWLFKQQKWSQAARCFGEKSLLVKHKKYYRGRLLRNAALLWRKAAMAGPKGQATSRYQRAILYFQQYSQDKLCLDVALCEQAAALAKTLCQQVGCGSLEILAKPAFALLQVKAGLWTSQRRERWFRRSMPPGRYVIKASGDGLKSRHVVLQLTPKKVHKMTLSLLPPQPVVRRRVAPVGPDKPPQTRAQPPAKASPSVLGWVGAIGGGVLLIGGGVLLGVGHATFADFRQRWDDPQQAAPSPSQREETRSQSDAMAASGIALLSVGGALAVIGIVAFVLNKPPAPQPTNKTTRLAPSTSGRHVLVRTSP